MPYTATVTVKYSDKEILRQEREYQDSIEAYNETLWLLAFHMREQQTGLSDPTWITKIDHWSTEINEGESWIASLAFSSRIVEATYETI